MSPVNSQDDDPADRLEAVINGWLPVSALDDRALAADYPRALRQLMKDNALVPGMRRVYDEMAQELFARTDEKLRASLLNSVDTMLEIMEDTSVEPAQRLRAAIYVFERMRGKTPDVVEVRQDKPFNMVLERIVAGERSAPPTVIEGTVEEVPEPAPKRRRATRTPRPRR